MWTTLLASFLLACTGAPEVAPEPAPPEPAPAQADADQERVLTKTKVTAKPLEEGVAVVMFAHTEYPGATLVFEGEEKGPIPHKLVTSTGLHHVVLKTEDGVVFDHQVPVAQRRTGVLVMDLARFTPAEGGEAVEGGAAPAEAEPAPPAPE